MAKPIGDHLQALERSLAPTTSDAESSAALRSTSRTTSDLQKHSGASETALRTARRITELVSPEQLVDEQTFIKWVPRFSANFGTNYAGVFPPSDGRPAAPTADAVKMRMVYEQMVRLGWSNEMFEERAAEFLAECKWPTWTIAEFFEGDAQPVQLHPYSWYVAQAKELASNAGDIACYLDDQGRKGWGWIHELEGRLVRAPQERGWRVEALPEPEEPSEELREQISVTKLELRITELEADLERVRKERDEIERQRREARERAELYADTIAAYERLITELINGEVTVPDLIAEMNDDEKEEAA